MVRQNYTPTPIKEAIVRARNEGQKVKAVAQLFQVGTATVERICKRERECGNVSRKAKSGRPRKTAEWHDKAIFRHCKEDPKRSATDVVNYASQKFRVQISKWTARRILKRRGLYARRPARVPLLQERHRKARLQFAQRHKNWTRQDWGRVLWSDETKINLYHPDGGLMIRRPVGMRYRLKYCKPTVKFGAGNIMVWGRYFILSFTQPIPLLRVHVP